MIDKTNESLYLSIKTDCISMINNKSVNIDDLCYQLGISETDFYKIFKENDKDFTIYLKLYNILAEM